jgi:lysophospholipase L1-like esterase
VRADFLGDSFTAGDGDGLGGDKTKKRMTAIAAASLGWVEVNRGYGGTGYTTDGRLPGGQSYLKRVPEILSNLPDVVVVLGGINDASAPAATVTDDATKVFRALLAGGIPRNRIVVVGPINPGPVASREVAATNQAIATAARSASVSFIDAIGENWFANPRGLVGSDHFHPNGKGYAQLGKRLLADLRKLDLPATVQS